MTFKGSLSTLLWSEVGLVVSYNFTKTMIHIYIYKYEHTYMYIYIHTYMNICTYIPRTQMTLVLLGKGCFEGLSEIEVVGALGV